MFGENDSLLNKLQYFIRKGHMSRWLRDSVLNDMKFKNEILYTTSGSGVDYSTTGSPTVTIDGLYTVLKYTGNGNFIINSGSGSIQSLLVGGGGGGCTGGGGGGDVQPFTETISAGTFAIVVGTAGAASGYNNGLNGTNGGSSTFNGHTATGGGGGGQVFANGSNGASGGGGGQDNATLRTGGTATGTNVNAGGNNLASGNFPGGGGGGAGAVGGVPPNGTTGGAGGNGFTSNITGSNVVYGGGGGGGVNNSGGTTGGAGGTGGGGHGSDGLGVGSTVGTANTGGGGGGGANNSTGKSGGTGVVILRFLTLIPGTAVIKETTLVESSDSPNNGQQGRVKFGDVNGETILQGTTVKSTGSLLVTSAAALSAVGSVQGDALLLTNDVNEITTTPSGSGVQLPAVAAGSKVFVANNGVNTLKVWPAPGQKIDALGTNNSHSVATTVVKTYVGVSNTQWYSA